MIDSYPYPLKIVDHAMYDICKCVILLFLLLSKMITT